jgi:hypothetical protein
LSFLKSSIKGMADSFSSTMAFIYARAKSVWKFDSYNYKINLPDVINQKLNILNTIYIQWCWTSLSIPVSD